MINRNLSSIVDCYKEFVNNGSLTFIACLSCTAILPVYVHYLPPFMILWGFFWFFENRSGMWKRYFFRNKPAILFIIFVGFFLWQISGLLLADSLNTGFEKLFKRLSFVLFPFVLFYPGGKIIEKIHLILRLFVICTFIYIIICFGNALHNSITIQSHKWIFNPHPQDYAYENFFYGARLSYLVHPSYLAMYLVISILISLESFINYSFNIFRKIFWLLIVVVFISNLYFLSSRAGMLAGIVVLPLYFLFKSYKKFPKWIILLTLVILAVLSVEIAKTNDKVLASFKDFSNENFDEILKNDERLMIWKSAIGVIKENFVFGVGTGDASEELKREFKSRGYVNGFYDSLNAHNQFLEILLENGLIGLILFLSILGYMAYIAILQKNILSGLFIIMMVIFFMFETVLNRLAGITFFPFFSFLLLHEKSEQGK